MRIPLTLAAVLFAACGKDPVCSDGYQLLNGECVELLDPNEDDTTAHPDPDTGDTGDEDCTCDVCEEGGSFSSVQSAIDAASDGDSITICAGEYKEVLSLTGVSVSLIGAGSSTTTIHADGDSTVLSVSNGQGAETTISGLTLRQGDAFTNGGYGGGLLITASSPTLTDIAITEADATNGAGIALFDSNSTIDGLHIVGAAAEDEGGGIYIDGGSPWIVHAVLEDNYAQGAAGLYAINSATRLDNSVFFSNRSAQGAGAIHMASGQGVTITNVVAALNTTGNGKESCAIEVGAGSTMYNTVAYGNEGTGLCSDGTAAYNLGYANHEGDFMVNGSPDPGEGDLTDDPQFVDPNLGDYTIRTASPVVDAGNPDVAYNDADGSRADMGVYGGPESDW
ncbi:MAG: hypothetical protein ACI8RZ_001237 [Myxococcota bacterium]|jgi:hypothetical protein